jgi:hypothetical protein
VHVQTLRFHSCSVKIDCCIIIGDTWSPSQPGPNGVELSSRLDGENADDAIRSLVISYKLLGTREWFVIHHSNWGMELFTGEIVSGLLARSLHTSS